MAHFRFRRSFGNVGTRRFRGARPDATPVTPGIYNYLRPDGLSLYRQPDAISLYKRPLVPVNLSTILFNGQSLVFNGTNLTYNG